MAEEKKLGLFLLVLLGIGSMIGGGIFNSPTDLISVANPQTTLLAWLVGGVGVLCLALVFQLLANRRPELKGGIYSYARAGFGEFIGFNSAWGYWLSGFLGNVAFFVLMFKTLNTLIGRQISPVAAFVIASVILWIYHYIITLGVRGAGIINAIVTIAKLLPLALVIIFGLLVFKPDIFFVPNWGTRLMATGQATTVFSQINSAMGTILWCFVGVEAAVVLSQRAISQRLVGKATVISLIINLGIYVLISTIAMGVVPAKSLAAAGTPLGTVLNATLLGGAGAVIVNLGLLISILGALMPWILLSAEIPYIAGKDGIMPKWFARENAKGVPINSLIITNGITQVFLISLLSPALQTAYYTVYYIATTNILIPYLFSALFAIKVCSQDKSGFGQMLISLVATVYALYVIYAVGITYLGLAFIMYAIGVIPFLQAKREKDKKITPGEIIAIVILVLIGLFMLYQVATGKISP